MYTLGFIGAGNMAEAIASAAICTGVLSADRMIAADPSASRRNTFSQMGVTVTASNQELIAQSEQLILAIKPQIMPEATTDLAARMRNDQIVVSIMAGITTQKLHEAIRAGADQPTRLVRAMPNTPLMIGCGMTGIALGPGAQQGDDDLAMELFGTGNSIAIRVPESVLDAITAVSGSGPAYLFYLAEAMQRGAAELGLEQHAEILVTQTLLGAAQLLSKSGNEPADLRRKVTSPGGTTEAAINHMEGNKTIDVIVNAIKAAEARSRKLGTN